MLDDGAETPTQRYVASHHEKHTIQVQSHYTNSALAVRCGSPKLTGFGLRHNIRPVNFTSARTLCEMIKNIIIIMHYKFTNITYARIIIA